MASAVYTIRNIASRRVYVGSAVDVGRRWYLHRSLLKRGKHHSILLQRSWEKHGAEAFEFEVVEIVPIEHLIAREQYWIDTLKACNPDCGFNIAPKAGSSLGRKHPPEVIAKMKLMAPKTKPPFTAEHKAAISAGRIGNRWSAGIPKSAEHRRKLSEAKMGRKNPLVSLSNKARVWTEEARHKLSVASLGNTYASDYCKRQRKEL